MAKKEISGYVKLQIKGGQANPAPPVGPALGQRGINIMEFCKAFNEKTKEFMGKPVPVVITVYKDKKFDFIIKTPPASHFIKEAAKIKGGSQEPGRNIVASITKKQAEEIAKKKMKDINDHDVNEATKIITNEKKFLEKSSKNCSVFVGSWGFNYNSWKEFQKKNKYILVKYEDLINRKKTVFIRIFKFFEQLGIKLELDMSKLNMALKSTEFEKMKFLEKKEEFDEALIDEKTGKRRIFFN